MALAVQYGWLDGYSRLRRQTLTTTSTTIAAALTDVTAFVALWDAVSNGGLQQVSISTRDNADAFAAVAGSNIDVNASLRVQGADGFKYDLDLPMIIDSLVNSGGSIIIGDAALVAWTNQFLVGGKWRVNNRFPTEITSVISGELDK